MQKRYYIGLDIGTDSVGYAAADTKYDLLKIKGERAWGVHLFDAAELCRERRSFRSARRRLDRRQFRVHLLQEIFVKEIAAVDDKFFTRLKNSALWRDDAGEPYCLFNDKDYTDKEYHTDYPTIHHLICELMSSEEKHDVRLVYIALAWLVVHRGHFLNEISRENISGLTDFDLVYRGITNWFDEREIEIPDALSKPEILSDVLRHKISVSKKFDMLKKQLNGGKKFPKDETQPVNIELLLKLFCGSKVSVKELFFKDDYAEHGSFSLDSADDVLAELFAKLTDDETELLQKAKAVFDWVVLVDILGGCDTTISKSKLNVYKTHQDDLKWLKTFIKKHCPNEYAPMFRDEAIPHNDCAQDAQSDFSADCTEISQAYCRMSRDFCAR